MMVPPKLDELVQLFYNSLDELGKFQVAAASDMPPPYRGLLDHQHHMTVTVEKHFGSPVDVQVLAVRETDDHYSRKIVLTTRSDQRVVQFGIVRLRWDALTSEVIQLIKAAQSPLGRILIEHQVMRDVSLADLWRIEPAAELKDLFRCRQADCTTFGRTALIRVDRAPAVELLEIVVHAGRPWQRPDA